MKKIILILGLIAIILSSCSKDDDGGFAKLENQENTILEKVYSNTPGVPIVINGINGGYLIIKDHWERKYIAKSYISQIFTSCKDKTVLITCEIYINGKLMQKVEGNGRVKAGVKIK